MHARVYYINIASNKYKSKGDMENEKFKRRNS